VTLWQEWKEKISSSLHTIVDRALESSSVALYDQSLRDMESYINSVEEAAVSMKAAAEGNKRRLAQYRSEAEILKTHLDQLLAKGMTEKAARTQQALNIKQKQIAETQAQIERQEGQHETLTLNRQILKERLQVLQGERGSVVALMTMARAERAISSFEYTLNSLAGLGGHSKTGVMADHILQRLNEAEARLALVDVDTELSQAIESIEEARVEEQLGERLRRLGLTTPQADEPSEKEVTTETDKAPEDKSSDDKAVEPEKDKQPETTKEPPET